MFKVSDDLDSDDDFLEKEFSDDFLSRTPDPHCAGSSKGFAAKSPSFEPFGGLAKKSCSSNDVTPTRLTCSIGVKSSTPITRGFQPKTKTSPVLLNSSADTSSTHFKTSPPSRQVAVTHRPRPKDARQSPSGKDDRVLYRNGSTNSVEVPYSKAPISLLNSPPSSTASNNVEDRNSAFLAEWNDDSFFNAPQEQQPVPSPAVHNHTPEVVTRKVNRTVRQRRFPGPAGLLPPRQGNTSLIAPEDFLNELKSEDSDPTYQEAEILSQSSGSVFEGGAWSAMLEDLGPSGQSLLKGMNLASIKAVGRNLRSYKVPFLSLLVQSIDASLPDTAVVFKDLTGEMHGVIHRDVWDQFSSDIAVGTVLVLRNVGIISAGVSSRKHVVNITGNNLTAIYSPKDELNIQLRRIHEFAASTSSKLLAEWEKVESQTNNSASPLSRRVQTPPRFTGFHSGGNYSESIARTADSRPLSHPNHNPSGRSISRPMAPSFTSTNRPMASSFNQRDGPMAPSINQRNGPMAPSINQRNGPVASSANPCHRRVVPNNGPMDQNYNPPRNGPVAQNACRNSSAKAPSSSSPFSPMLSRQSSWPTNQNSPVNTNNENSNLAVNQTIIPKSPFTMKSPASSRPLTSQNKSHSNTCDMPNPPTYCNQPPLTTKAPPPSQPSILPVKKPRLCQNVASAALNCQNSPSSKKNPFQFDADASAIDSLLEGIDTDSLFGDF